LTLAMLGPALAAAQPALAGRALEIHGFFSQGFTKSDGNNYLTMPTSRGAFDFTDGGVSVAASLTGKLRIGAQAYVRNIGHLGNGRVTLDWATADYHFRDYLGFRGGQVKTVLGLHNDTQDLEFLHTWALLPQSLYPLDLRGLSLSHRGVDVYGTISPRKWGTFSYTAYAGQSPPDPEGGWVYGFASYGLRLDETTASLRGGDLKWNTPLPGLLLGASYLDFSRRFHGENLLLGGRLDTDARANNLVLSAQYSRGKLRLDYERTRQPSVSVINGAYGPGGPAVELPYDTRGWYAAAAYRVSSNLELGAYHSRFYPNADRQVQVIGYLPAEARHVYDQSFTARFDFKTYWDLKLEGHLMNGYGDPGSTRGFYPQDNPAGLKATTKLLVIRLGFNY
jgi:hypothetical protein